MPYAVLFSAEFILCLEGKPTSSVCVHFSSCLSERLYVGICYPRWIFFFFVGCLRVFTLPCFATSIPGYYNSALLSSLLFFSASVPVKRRFLLVRWAGLAKTKYLIVFVLESERASMAFSFFTFFCVSEP